MQAAVVSPACPVALSPVVYQAVLDSNCSNQPPSHDALLLLFEPNKSAYFFFAQSFHTIVKLHPVLARLVYLLTLALPPSVWIMFSISVSVRLKSNMCLQMER
jgi:hypothetical protein